MNARSDRISFAFIIVACFFATMIGGYILTDAVRLDAGAGTLLFAIYSGDMVPQLTHALLAIIALGGVGWILKQRKIQQVPTHRLSGLVALFFGLLAGSVTLSEYKFISIEILLEWMVYGAVFFGVVASGGRRLGPQALLTAIGAGCTVVALKGIAEYSENRATDPTWRIFAGWVNPNATAAILLIGFFCLLAIAATRQRLEGLIATIAVGMIGFALVLTGSKGAVSLGLPIGLLAYGFTAQRLKPVLNALALFVVAVVAGIVGFCFLKNIAWVGLGLSAVVSIGLIAGAGSPETRSRAAGSLGSALALTACLVALLSVTGAKPAGEGAASIATPVARLGQGAAVQEQSSTFRLNLWKSAAHLIKARPISGFGLGSYRYESARSGLTTQTILAHNVYLQLWAEAGVGAALCFIAVIIGWYRYTLASRVRIAPESLALLSAVTAAVTAVLIHSLVDSDLYYFGIGLCFFALLGVGLLLSSDSVAPEFVDKAPRAYGVVLCAGLGALMLFTGYTEALKARVRNDQMTMNREGIEAGNEQLKSLTSFDGDALYLLARTQPPSSRIETLQAAHRLQPSTKIGRALADSQASEGQFSQAVSTLTETLTHDPNSLITLTSLKNVYVKSGDVEGALKTARRIVDVEQLPYFKVRSLQDLVPTETADARLFLAEHEADKKKKLELLRRAVQQYAEFSRVTISFLLRQAKSDPNVRIGNVGIQTAQEILGNAKQAAQLAAQGFREAGATDAVAEMVAADETFGKALTDLGAAGGVR